MELTKIEAASEFNLFDLFAKCQNVGVKRKANDDECRAYAKWLAMKAGTIEALTNSPKLEWKNFDRRGRERVCIGAYFGDAFIAFPGADQNGAVTFELLDESGNVETAGTIYTKPNGALNIASSDAAAMKESAKAWAKANKGKANAAPVVTPIAEPAPAATLSGEFEPSYRELPNGDYETSDKGGNIWLHRADGSQELIHDETGDAMQKAVAHAKLMQDSWQSFQDEYLTPETPPETPEPSPPATTLAGKPEIKPQDEKNAAADDIEAQPDAMAALMARMDALEASLASVSSKASSESTPPIAAMETDAPLSGELRAKRSPAHIRAIMAYLAMRKQRRIFRDAAQQFMDARDHIQNALNAECESHAATQMAMEKYQRRVEQERALVYDLRDKRRRSTMKALTIRQALKREKAISHDRFQQVIEISRSRSTVSQELASLKAKIADPSNPVRESDMLLLKGNAEAWQAKAERAIAESDRLRRLAVQNAGHIDTLANRVARAETMLRDSGAMPVLTLVPPTASVAA